VTPMRVRIELPDTLPFATELPVLIEHINEGQHLDNARLLGLVAEGRCRLLAALGFSQVDIGGAGIILADAAVQYRSEAFHGEVLRCAFGLADPHRYGFDLVWQLTETGTGREVARGKHGVVAFDYTARRKTPVPEQFWRAWAKRFGGDAITSAAIDK